MDEQHSAIETGIDIGSITTAIEQASDTEVWQLLAQALNLARVRQGKPPTYHLLRGVGAGIELTSQDIISAYRQLERARGAIDLHREPPTRQQRWRRFAFRQTTRAQGRAIRYVASRQYPNPRGYMLSLLSAREN